MGKDIDGIYKHSQSQLSTPSIKKPVFPYSASQTSSSINSTRTCVSSIIDKDQTDSVLCSQNTTHNYLNITNNNNIHSCDTPGNQHYRIPTTSTPNCHTKRIGDMLVRLFKFTHNCEITASR